MSLTVAVTGPTGDIGRAFLLALESADRVDRVIGMARRPFDPASIGAGKTEYRQGDITRREDVERLVADADVVVHLAFLIVGGGEEEMRRINLEGSRNVFEAAAAAKNVKRLVYTSSVAAYGFHADNPLPLRESIEPRGTDAHYYSAQKAELEATLEHTLKGSGTEAYVFRPCIVAGPHALTLVEQLPYVQAADELPGAARRLLGLNPLLKPVIPDPGTPFQLVHHDDVASALVAGTVGEGHPGVYNLAGEGTITASDLAEALGWYSIPIPGLAVDAAAELIARLPFAPPETQWINAAREPVVMDTSRAQQALHWHPHHAARDTLHSTVQAAKARGLV